MTPARWTLAVIFGACLMIGIGMGLVNLVAPGTANITFNDAPATGLTGVIVAAAAWGFPGLIFGLIAAGIVTVFSRGKSKA
jgi:hypothetical protein